MHAADALAGIIHPGVQFLRQRHDAQRFVSSVRELSSQVRGAAKPRVRDESVFLNIPYNGFENLLLAYIAASAPSASLRVQA